MYLRTSIYTLFQSFTSLKDPTVFIHTMVFVFLSIFSIFVPLYVFLMYAGLCFSA